MGSLSLATTGKPCLQGRIGMALCAWSDAHDALATSSDHGRREEQMLYHKVVYCTL